MALYNVRVTKTTLMVVEAEDAEMAAHLARCDADEAFRDDYSSDDEVDVLDEITSLNHLRDGWDGNCTPYGDNNRRRIISEILKG